MKKSILVSIAILATLCGCSTPLKRCYVTEKVYKEPYETGRAAYWFGWPTWETTEWSYQRYFIISGTNPQGCLENATVHVSQEVWDNATPGMPWPDL